MVKNIYFPKNWENVFCRFSHQLLGIPYTAVVVNVATICGGEPLGCSGAWKRGTTWGRGAGLSPGRWVAHGGWLLGGAGSRERGLPPMVEHGGGNAPTGRWMIGKSLGSSTVFVLKMFVMIVVMLSCMMLKNELMPPLEESSSMQLNLA